ncbi:hypothetical protein O3G_MSEX003555 [Manduca sexta]|uniref:Uncharacterized protein n=1 Tax=Manduca sexta TaxID=7130 RepID=A0A921YSK4_MANSE|nr:hypothetical protein O3G_MSEX003555 [Manduca sexta]
MQNINNQNNLFSPENLKFVEVNSFSVVESHQKNFINGIRNLHNLINNLEKSINTSKKYEKRLFQCKANHAHSHNANEWWDTDVSEEKREILKGSERDKSVELAASWSTVSIVCLQYQYEELSKRYDSLLQVYENRCKSVNACNVSILNLRQRLKSTHEQLSHAHRALLAVGDKYLALRRKRNRQKGEYEDKILKLEEKLKNVLKIAEQGRLKLDSQLAVYLAEERNSEAAMLLVEIRKCNQLFLENLRLKTQIEERPAGNVN